MATMAVIEQAKGIIMAECGWTPDQAVDALRNASQRENIELRDVAARVVANTAASDGLPRISAARRAPPETGSAADRAVAVKPSPCSGEGRSLPGGAANLPVIRRLGQPTPGL
jgi:hypothetical protein